VTLREHRDSVPMSCPKCGNGEPEWFRGPFYSVRNDELQYSCKICFYEFSTDTVEQQRKKEASP